MRPVVFTINDATLTVTYKDKITNETSIINSSINIPLKSILYYEYSHHSLQKKNNKGFLSIVLINGDKIVIHVDTEDGYEQLWGHIAELNNCFDAREFSTYTLSK